MILLHECLVHIKELKNQDLNKSMPFSLNDDSDIFDRLEENEKNDEEPSLRFSVPIFQSD